MKLLDLPSEILGEILANLRYDDCLHAFATCRHLQSFSHDQLLWRAVFLHDFDDPRHRHRDLNGTAEVAYKAKYGTFDWRVQLKKRMIALRCLRDAEVAHRQCTGPAYEEFAEAILDIIDTSAIANSANAQLLPQNVEFRPEVDCLIRGTLRPRMPMLGIAQDVAHVDLSQESSPADQFWEPSPGHPMTRSRAALQADKVFRSENASRLHVLCGYTPYEDTDEKSAGRARRICYDWSLTNEKNEYGPWKDDGSGETDWRRVEALITVVARRFIRAARRRITLPQGFRYSIPNLVSIDPAVPEDWAGVQRKWAGTYVFMHWEDLVEYNEFRDTNSRPTLENMPEACGGVMKLDLKLDMELKDDITLRTTLPFCDDLPPLYFSGLSRSDDWQMATGIRGMCCLAPGGREVRWRYIVQYVVFRASLGLTNGTQLWRRGSMATRGCSAGRHTIGRHLRHMDFGHA